MRITEEEYQELMKSRIANKAIGEETKRSRLKYGNQKQTIRDPRSGEDITFDSKKEMEYYLLLVDKEKKGEIYDLQRQVKLTILEAFRDITGREHRAINYFADFVYKERINPKFIDGKIISDEIITHVVDVKGGKATRTEVYKIKMKLLAHKGIIIEEV